MNSYIIEWLNNNNNNNSINNTNNKRIPSSLIECILILSINGTLIDIQSLINYCNNVINNDKDNNKIIINNNNKRIKNNINDEEEDEDEISPPSYYHGLSKQQFQTIHKNINNINNTINNSPTINNNENYNNDTEECISNKIKFTNSISIINENNKRILKQKQINSTSSTSLSSKQPQNTFNSSNNNNNNNNNNIKKIKSCNCNNNNNNIIISSNNNGIRDIDIVFFKVWRNLIVRNEILFHTKLFNIHHGIDTRLETPFTFDEFSNYKYKSYLRSLKIFELKQVGDLKTIIFKSNVLPSNLLELGIHGSINATFEVNSIPDSVTSVKLYCSKTNQEFNKGVFPDSITSLKLGDNLDFNQKLSLEWLPSSLKILKLNNSFRQPIEQNQLPESLTELKLHKDYNGAIVPGSIPLGAIKSFSYKFESNRNQKELKENSIPKTTTCLEFDHLFNQTIKPGFIPHNVTSINLSVNFNSEIQIGSLPLSLKLLKLGYSFNRVIDANVLPPNLTSIDMGDYNQTLIPDLFPRSIKSIKFFNFNQLVPTGYFYDYKNLKSLDFFGDFSQTIPVRTLPSSLTALKLGCSYNMSLNSLPTSLTKLVLMSSDYQLSVGELPSSITSLSLNSNQLIPVGSLPCNLRELYIENKHFNQDITVDGILPQSLQLIYINAGYRNFINSLSPDFLNKYIKFIK